MHSPYHHLCEKCGQQVGCAIEPSEERIRELEKKVDELNFTVNHYRKVIDEQVGEIAHQTKIINKLKDDNTELRARLVPVPPKPPTDAWVWQCVVTGTGIRAALKDCDLIISCVTCDIVYTWLYAGSAKHACFWCQHGCGPFHYPK